VNRVIEARAKVWAVSPDGKAAQLLARTINTTPIAPIKRAMVERLIASSGYTG
jgi:hypothetical protein